MKRENFIRETFNGVMLRSGGTLLSGVGGQGIYKAVISEAPWMGSMIMALFDIKTNKFLDEIVYHNTKQISEIWEILERRVLIEKIGHYL